jgi:uncharacterized membrane protein YphA (DoxX/SURF4 family)
MSQNDHGAERFTLRTPCATVLLVSNLLGPFAVVAVVLVAGGVFKLRDPGPTHDLLRSLRLPPTDAMARTVGALEIVLGGTALVISGPAPAIALAVTYAVFATVSWRLLHTGGAVSCGCFGRASAPPSAVHVVANVGAALVAMAAAITATDGLWTGRDQLEGGPLPTLALVAAGAWLLVTVMTVLPDTLAATRRGPLEPAVPAFALAAHHRHRSPQTDRTDQGPSS